MNLRRALQRPHSSLALLAGCGNKGPLVLATPPPSKDPASVPETAPEPVPADATQMPTADATPADAPAADSTTPPAETPAAETDGDGHG